MAVDKSKVVDRFKELFGTTGLSNARRDEISAKLAAKLNDDVTEEQIDERLNELNEIYPFSEIKKNDDRATNDKKNPNRQTSSQQSSATNDNPDKDDRDDPMSVVLKKLTDMEGKLSAFESEKKQQSISERFKKDIRLKGIPDFILNKSIPTDEDGYEDAVTELAAEYKSFAEKEKLASYGNDIPARGKGGEKGKVEKISAEDAKKVVANM